MNRSEARAKYDEELSKLTVEKALINFLSMLAADYKAEFPEEVVGAIAARVQQHPLKGLACLYLLDSIIKNVRDPYPKLFQNVIVPLMRRLTEELPEKDVARAKRVRNTWNKIFPADVLAEVDVTFQQRESRQAPPPAARGGGDPRQRHHQQGGWGARTEGRAPPGPAHIDPVVELQKAEAALARGGLNERQYHELHNLVARLKQDLYGNPNGYGGAGGGAAYGTLPPPNTGYGGGPPGRYPPSNGGGWNQQQQQYMQLQQNDGFRRPLQPATAADPRVRPALSQQQLAQPEPQSPSTLDLESLLADAAAAGLLPVTPTAADDAHPLDGGGGGADVAAPIGFSADDQKKRHPGVVESLYEHRPRKCEQCGLRFLESEGKEHDAHMDWHFRDRQSKSKTSSQFRGWQYTLELWLTLNDVREDEQQVEVKSIFAKEAAAGEAAEDHTVYEVPVGDDKNASCGICGERLNATFNADEEEWKYVDVIRSEGVLYKVSCVKNQGGDDPVDSAAPDAADDGERAAKKPRI